MALSLAAQYLFVFFFLMVGECTVAGFFLSTKARKRMIDAAHPPEA
jgi:hypothetical protein